MEEIVLINELQEYLKTKKRVYLYGAGDFSICILRYCNMNMISIEGIVVSDKSENLEYLFGYRVCSLDEIKNETNINMIVAIRDGKRKVGNLVEKKGFESILYCSDKMIDEIAFFIWEKKAAMETNDGNIVENYPELETGFLMMIDKELNIPVARFNVISNIDDIINNLDLCSINNLKKEYGENTFFLTSKKFGVNKYNNKICIYVATSHADREKQEIKCVSGYKFIQVGAALTKKRFGYVTDDVGDNISGKNDIYSECTAHYWIWKNVNNYDYVGVNHYRRKQMFNDISIEEIIEKNYDIVLPTPQFTGCSFKEYYLRYSEKNEWEALDYVISERNDKYIEILHEFAEGKFYFPCNILFAKKSIFDDYCKFLFSITKGIEEYFEYKKILKRKRYMGYLIEILENLYLIKNKESLKLAYTDIMFTRS